ncbi:hypothetical protein CNMCM6805_010012 [Aspergillus fumigatiaffinis]|uniref:Uncharacterized protein n=1 Tax=Aspergillus fumigatiaffinis TaxID=340414 RepID=A0A8H4H0S7_9EURO|nr:hypothetical protein CNMCM6805_010012 [Aspergillus fumigatiaffinis]
MSPATRIHLPLIRVDLHGHCDVLLRVATSQLRVQPQKPGLREADNPRSAHDTEVGVQHQRLISLHFRSLRRWKSRFVDWIRLQLSTIGDRQSSTLRLTLGAAKWAAASRLREDSILRTSFEMTTLMLKFTGRTRRPCSTNLLDSP